MLSKAPILFCKGFFEPCIAAGGFRPNLLMLRRDARSTALSHLRKNSVPGRTGGAGVRYLISPHDRPYLEIERPDDLSDYQLCYWYCLEIELRQALYGQIADQLGGMQTASLFTKELGDLNRLVEISTALQLAPPADIARTQLAQAGGWEQHIMPRQKTSLWSWILTLRPQKKTWKIAC